MTSEVLPEPKVPASTKQILKRLPQGSLRLQFAGDLIFVKCPDPKFAGLFRRYEALFEAFANMPKDERTLNYKFLNALMLTSYAKKVVDRQLKKDLFEKKNSLFLDITNHESSRRKVVLRYLVSRKVLVKEQCDACKAINAACEQPTHVRKYCKNCTVDRSFYNILSMRHGFTDGYATLFLSNDKLDDVVKLNLTQKGKLSEAKEEAIFKQYHYNVQNLDAFDLKSVTQMFDRLTTKKSS